MARRRGRGEGSIRERQDGRWEVRVDVGRGPDGKRRRKSAFAPTQGEAVKLLKKLAGRQMDGDLSTSTPTMARFLENWYALHADDWRPSTRRCYRGAIDGFLVPAFGTMRVEQVNATAIESWMLEHKREHGARRRVVLAHATLRSALSYAEGKGLISRNPASAVKVPQPVKRTAKPLTLEQARTFLAAASAHHLGALFSVAISCGLRLGEATGLRWEDVDLTTGDLRIRQQLQRDGRRLVAQELKTEKSRRTLALPQMCLETLKAHRKQQLKDRLKAGADWVETGLVFTTFARRGAGRKVGQGLQPRNVLRTLDLILTAAKLPHIRFHDLRHSAASLLIAEGVQLAEVSMLLGHSELRVTS